MQTLTSIPSNLMSESPNVVYLAGCFDKYNGLLTSADGLSGTVSLSPAISPALATGVYNISYVSGQSIIGTSMTVTVSTTTSLTVTGTDLPIGTDTPISFYAESDENPQAFDLVITETITSQTATIRIEPAPDGTARLELQELIKLLLPEPSTPNSGESSYNQLSGLFTFGFNELTNINLQIFVGNNVQVSVINTINNLYGIRRKAFKELPKAVLTPLFITPIAPFSVPVDSLTAGDNDYSIDPDNPSSPVAYFKLYNAVSCREPRYLSGYYGFDVDNVNGINLIDVSTVILAYIDQYGYYDYLRFSGNNAPFKAIVEATTVQRIGATLDNNTYTEYSNLGNVFEGIDLVATSDTNTNYIIDNIEQQRILDALNTAKYVWLCVPANDSETKAIPVRVQRESVRYQGALNTDIPIIQASILLNLPLRQIN